MTDLAAYDQMGAYSHPVSSRARAFARGSMKRNPYTDRTWWTVVFLFHAIPAAWWAFN